MTRHHDKCQCSQCKQKLSKGKVKGQREATPNIPGGVKSAVAQLSPVLQERFPVAELEAKLEELCNNPTKLGDLYASERKGSLTDLLWELEERTLPNVLTNGAHKVSQVQGMQKKYSKPSLDWRDSEMLQRETRKVEQSRSPLL